MIFALSFGWSYDVSFAFKLIVAILTDASNPSKEQRRSHVRLLLSSTLVNLQFLVLDFEMCYFTELTDFLESDWVIDYW